MDWNKKVIQEFRANNGKVGGVFKNMDLLLLHTVGSRSGSPRLVPLVYTADGGRYVVIASAGGSHRHPDWFFNLAANPEVEVEIGSSRFKARAAVIEEPERSRLYERMAAKYDFFAEYKEKAKRVIPVIVLERRASREPGSN